MTRVRPRRRWIQLAIFVLVAISLENFASWRLRVEEYETLQAIATLDAGPDIGWRLNQNKMRTEDGHINQDGLRNAEVTSPRPDGEFRVLMLGGSVAYGLGVRENETCETFLQQSLQQSAPPNVHCSVINGGIPGFTTLNMAALLFHLGERYQPNIVVLMCGYNDQLVAGLASPPSQDAGDWHWSRTVPDRIRSVLIHSATYRYLMRKLLDRRVPPVSENDDAWVGMSCRNVVTIADYVQARGAHLVLALEAKRSWEWMQQNATELHRYRHDPASWSALTKAYDGVVAARPDIAWINLGETLRDCGHGEDALFRADDPVHLTDLGNQVVAAAILKTLQARGWMPAR